MPLSEPPPSPEPPVAPRRPARSELHGEVRVDPYAWLRKRDDPEVRAYLVAENAYTAAVMAPQRELERRLYDETVARLKQTDQSVPVRRGEHEYYSRTEEGKQYRIHCRRPVAAPGAEQIVLDLNELARDKPFLDLGAYTVSDDGRLLAYTLDETGYREYTLRIKDLATGKDLGEKIEHVGTVAWAADGQTLFYTVEDDEKRSYRVYRHGLGRSDDALVREEPDERFSLYVWRTRSKAFVMLGAYSHTTSEVAFLPAEEPGGEFRVIAPRVQDREYDVDHLGADFYLRINDTGRNFRVVRQQVGEPRTERWQEVVAQRDDVMLADLDVMHGRLVLLERENGLPHLRVIDLAGGADRRVAMPEPVYELSPEENPDQSSARFRFAYTSLATPRSVYEYDTSSNELVLLKRTEVLGGYDPADYRTERIFASAPDGAHVPVSLVRRVDTALDGSAPLLLEGYGAYGLSAEVYFDSQRVSLLDRGFICAIAHVRGGGELGKRWHDDGRMARKENTFGDFIAVAEMLVARGYTRADRLAIEGASAGGLLVGAVVNMRPELFAVAMAHVPFVDVLNTMLDDDLPLTVGEYEEWGDPRRPDDYARIRRYSPYDNIREQAYPAMLVTTSFNDSQVMYWEPAKYVARLRATKTDSNLLLLRTDMDGGHGGSSGRYDRIAERAFELAFLVSQLDAQR